MRALPDKRVRIRRGWTECCTPFGVGFARRSAIAAVSLGLLAAAPARAQWTEELHVPAATHPAPSGAPTAIVHAPRELDGSAPIHVVVFLHGWSGCARVLAYPGQVRCHARDREHEGWDLIGRFDEAHVNALFIIPQLAYEVRDGSAGRLLEPGHFRVLLDQILDGARRAHPFDGTLARVTLLAHSAGYESALAVLSRGGVERELRDVVLFDALYRGHQPFGEWALGAPERRLVSLHTGNGRPVRQCELLVALVRRGMPPSEVVVDPPPNARFARGRVIVGRSPAPHGEVPARHLAEILRAFAERDGAR
ncbi:MAG: hypothetical protein AB7S26_15945 [Sandaracinaceae bacterium]